MAKNIVVAAAAANVLPGEGGRGITRFSRARLRFLGYRRLSLVVLLHDSN